MPAGIHRPDSDIQPVVGIQFGIFGPDEIEKRSVVEVTNTGTYDGSEPRIGGLFDPRMGVLDNGKTCRSCGQTNHGCPGHFGHYRLARPVYFIQFFPYILNVLNCVCVRCSKLLIDKELHKGITKRRGEARWRAVLNKCSGISRCGQETEDGCGAIQPDRYTRDGIARITAEWNNTLKTAEPVEGKSKVTQVLEVEYVLRLFRRITDEDVDFMGLSRFWCRPDWMICSVLPIPPPQVRPSVIQDNNQRSEDDLTHKLFEIISTNQRLQDKINNNAAKNLIEDEHTVLQYHIATLVDNQIPGVAPSAQRSGRPLKSVQQRLGSKEGRIRYNIQGKRVEFSARSVITPDPNISIAEIGVPIKIAMNLTVPEKVTPYNKDQMYKLIQNGADKHPGAKTIVSANGSIKSLKHVNRREIVLHVGDVVNRHLDDGDIILFNRQPTLHRMSMMGHRVKVLPYNTFRLNVSVTAPYNADFDGDEMNAHIPQSYEASTELGEIAAVPHQIVTPRHAKPLIGIVQDTLVGSYRITQPHIVFNRREFMNMMMWNKRFEGVVPKAGRQEEGRVGRWTGQQVLTQLMPPINLDMGNGLYKDNKSKDNFVKIREGQITQGIFDKDIFSKPSKGIVHVTYRDYGPKDTVNLIDSMQNTVEQFLVYNGFSVGVSDLIADEDTRKEMEEIVKKRKAAIENILLQIHLDLFDNNTGKTNQQEFEDKVFTELNKATEEAGKKGLSSLADENRLVAMVRAGSKGSTINISQMMACVGQQAPEGRRIPYGFTDRTLPHFKKYDDGAEARGFVESSFIQGLTPQEFFFHAMSGREGLIDTAVKTADTGYIQRQLVKAMEDLAVQYDGSVRDSRMNIVQFKYGEDGINATKIESASLGLGKLSDTDIKRDYGMEGVDLTEMFVEGTLRGEDVDALAAFAQQVLDDRKMLVEGVQNSKQDVALFASVNIDRVLTNVIVSFRLEEDGKTDLTPLYVIQGIERLIQRTQIYHALWAALLRYYLAPHKTIMKHRLTRKAFDTVCEMILIKNWQGWAQPGEQVGIIAAQSIGEPSTQMTLNSVDWDTKIMIAKNGEIVCTQIGEFVDAHMAAHPDAIQEFPNNQLYLDLKDGNDWQAVSCDENGKMMWTKLEAITRHPVVNEDGTNTILEVELASGRSVKATKGKSFLTRVGDKVLDINGSDLKVGDVLPIANSLAIESLPTMKCLSVREHLPPTEWLYGSDAAAALVALNGTDRHWFQKNNGTAFTVPYSRSDAFREAFVDGKNTNAATIRPGFVYPARTRPDVSQIPAEIPLTESFGFFVGAYLAEGMSNATQVNITNNDTTYLAKVAALMTEWNVGAHTVCEKREAAKSGIKGTTTSLVIHSTLLATLVRKLFGRVSHEKTIPDWVFQAPDEFIRGLVDAYISGDGTVEKRTGCVKATSVSKDLLVRLGTLFARFGIFSTISERTPEQGVFDSVKTNYTIYIPVKYSAVFAKTFHLSMAGKQAILDEQFGLDARERICRRETTGDVIWDTIKSITEIAPMKDRVYDLTVATTRNFMTMDCIVQADTFHLAGVAAKSNVTRGVPRLKELLKVTQNPKAISLTVTLKPEIRDSKEKARKVAQDLELTLLKDITVKAAIYYDPDDADSVLEEDRSLIAFYKAFEAETSPNKPAEEKFGEEGSPEAAAEGGEGEAQQWSRLMLRLELDRQRMFRKNISMDDIALVLRAKFGEAIHLVYSDYNTQRLIMRIRIPPVAADDTGMDDMLALKKLQNRLLTGIVIRGVAGIKAVTFRQDKDTVEYMPEEGVYKPVTQYVLDTDGTNFLSVMNHPYVDGTKLVSSHVHDIYENLGIEATRSTLIQEITTLFEEAGVNCRHLGLLCDVMTRQGRLMSVDRYGINKMDIGPIAKASFEETEKILLRAALFSEVDPVTGISANIMMGQPIRGGTGFFNILFDEGAFMRLQEGLPPVEGGEEEDLEAPTQEQIDAELTEDKTDICSTARLRMNVAMPPSAVLMEEEDVGITIIAAGGEEEA
jgi:DNA-directed RNA polymerase beta' subunit